MGNVRSAVVILGEWSTISVLKWIIVEIELLMLQSEVTKSSGWHEISLYITGSFPSSFANDNVFLLKCCLQSFLLVFFVGIKRFRGFYSFIRLTILAESKNCSFRVFCVGHIELVVMDDGDQAA